MTVGELMEKLEEMDEHAEVRIAYQPSWPLQVAIANVADLTDTIPGLCDECDGYTSPEAAERELGDDVDAAEICDCDEDESVGDEDKVVWIATGSPTGTGYAPRAAWDE